MKQQKNVKPKAAFENKSYRIAYQASHIMQNNRYLMLLFTHFASKLHFYLMIMAVILPLLAVSTQPISNKITLYIIVFLLPFLLFSAIAGQFADNFDKTRCLQLLKFINIIVTIIAVFALITNLTILVLSAVFLSAMMIAFINPFQYSFLPEKYFNRQSLIANISVTPLQSANSGLLVVGIIAFLFAYICVQFGLERYKILILSIMLLMAILAWLSSHIVAKTNRQIAKISIDYNMLRANIGQFKLLWHNKVFTISSLIIAWFYILSLVLCFWIFDASTYSHSYAQSSLIFLVVLSCFMVFGMGLAQWCSAARSAFLPIFFAFIIGGLALLDFSYMLHHQPIAVKITNIGQFIHHPYNLHIMIDLAFIAVCLPFLSILSLSALQIAANSYQIGQIIAAKNTQNSVLVGLAVIIVAILHFYAIGWPLIFAILALLTIIFAIVLFIYLPSNPLCDFAAFLFFVIFRLEYKGIENLTKAGKNPILMIPYESMLDGLLALVLCNAVGLKTPIFFLDIKLTKHWYLRPFLKYMQIFSLDFSDSKSQQAFIKAQKQEKPLVILLDGRIAMTGDLMKNYDNAASLIEKAKAKIIAVKIDGLQQSYFAKQHKIPLKRQFFPKVKTTILPPILLKKTADLHHNMGTELYYMMSAILFKTSFKQGTLFEELVLAAQKYGVHKQAIEDLPTGKQNYRQMLIHTYLIAHYIKQHKKNENVLALMLPNSNDAIITFFAMQSAGKIPAMLNYTVGLASLKAALGAVNAKTIVTSKQFVEKAQLGEVINALKAENIAIIYLEKIKKTFSIRKKIAAKLYYHKPQQIGAKTENHAAILFTSGSEGTPKGVVLTHSNILANVVQIAARLDFIASDKVFNILPMFHSFGLTVATIMPLTNGVPVCFYPSPLHYREVPEAIYFTKASIIFSTDTFLNGYARNAQAYDLSSLRYCIAGAEPVKSTTRELMMQKFGIRVLEGYGVTEASPVISLNTPNYNKQGSVGKLLPGIETQLEKVESIELGGRLFVKGPNIMAGYLTIEQRHKLLPPKNGWHDTGDIVEIDEDGFVTILGRAKRFAKIGGEMVSLSAIEKLAAKLWPEINLAIVAVGDAKKGERLVLISDDEKPNRAELLQFARKNGVAEINIPTKFIKAVLPVLGTGKIDYVNLKKLAEETN